MDIWNLKTEMPVLLRDGDLTLPRRRSDSHKGDYGKLLLLGGCVGYTGAPCLCARAAVRAGAGLVYLGVPADIYGITAGKLDEAMPFPLPAEDGGFSPDAVEPALAKLERCDVCAVGPGMGRGRGGAELVRRLLEVSIKPLVLDADALNAVAGHLDWLDAHSGAVVLTPHEGEFLRLGGNLTGDRAADARRFALDHGVFLLLKGPGSALAFPDGRVFVCTHGNPGMAKGGSGDVLTGVLAAMLGQLEPERALLTGMHLHSLAGDLARDRRGEYGMTASDLIEALPEAEQRMMEA